MASHLLINEPPLQVLPSLAVKIGLHEAIVLQQVHYWLNPKFNKNVFKGCHWVHNTYTQWQAQFPFWSDKTIRRAITNLEEGGFLISFVTREFKKVKFYSIDYEILKNIEMFKGAKENEIDLKSSTIFDAPPGKASNPDVDLISEPILNVSPSGQLDQIDNPIWADRSGQLDPIDLVKLTSSYITENTTENTLLLSVSPNSEKAKRVEEEENDLSKKMILIWNKIIQNKLHPEHPVLSTTKRSRNLAEFLYTVFQGNLEKWEHYCTKISDSQFLMGKNQSGFKASLDWALNEDNSRKVLENAFFDAPSQNSPYQRPTSDEFLSVVEGELGDHPLKEIWLRICKELSRSFSPKVCITWFGEVVPLDLSGNVAVLEISAPFRKNYILTHFRFDLERAIRAVCPKITDVQFVIRQTNPKAHSQPNGPPP